MTTYKIYTTEGKSLKFEGNLIATVESNRISTSRGVVWFELNAYERENGQWVTSIGIKSSDSLCHEIFEFYSTPVLVAAEDSLYDFDPIRIMPGDLSIRSVPEIGSLPLTVDHDYYAAVRQLIREIEKYQNNRAVSPVVPESLPADPIQSTENGIVNRIRRWFHY